MYFGEETYSVQLSRDPSKLDLVEVATCRSTRRMQRLVYVSQEVSDPLRSIRTRQVRASTQRTAFHVMHAFSQDARLVRNGTDDTAAFRAVLVIVQMTTARRPVMCVYPVPLVGEVAFARMCVCVRPGCCTPYAAIVLRFEDLREKRRGLWCEEGFGHKDQLIVDCRMLALNIAISEECLPSVFQQAAGASSAAP
jgi:hypothetical protein